MADEEFKELLGLIKTINVEIEKMVKNINETNIARSKPTTQSGPNELSRITQREQKDLAALEAQYKRLEQIRKQYASQGYGSYAPPKGPFTPEPRVTPAPGQTYIPGGAPTTPLPSQFGSEYNSLLKELKGSGGLPMDSRDKLKAQEERLLQTLRGRVQSEEKYKQALDQATALGFKISDLKKSNKRGVSGIEQLQFERQDEGGGSQRFDTFVNPSGRATPGISNQFRSFGQGIVRDIGELTKWSIALAAVYGPLKKLQELTQIMIENQTRLAEATITVNSSFLSQGQIFDNAADAANRAGEEVSGVIDAFTQAYRAAGGSGTQVERFATANDLLADSLTLSKLSTLDQASAIDTLSAALRQTGRGLGEGSELLDGWVRVTKVANVDLATLATGFAVVGDAAEAAGIGVNELNGVIAAIAETGIASGKETANIARSLVSGFQSDQARTELEALGIAVEDTTGQMRPFLDIMKEIYNLRQTGAIDDTQFSKLTLALGGGTRRQAAYSSFIESFDRVFAIAQESEKASGDAEAALAKQLDTVQTSITRLGNSFESLAQTMGTEGGFLGIITEAVDGTASLVRIFDSLTGALGKTTPAILAFVAASAALKYRGQGGIGQVVSAYGQSLKGDPLESRLLGLANGGTSSAQLPFGQRAKNFIGTNVLGTNASSGAAQGLLTSILPAILNATNKEDRFGKTKAGADLVGGIAGGIVGTLTGAGPVIGGAIGTAIADAFISKTVAYETDLQSFANKPTLGKEGFAVSTSEDPEAALKQAQIDLYKSVGRGNEGVGRFLTGTSGPSGDIEGIVDKLNTAIKEGNKDAFDSLLSKATSGLGGLALKNAGITPELAQLAFKEKRPIEASQENIAYNKASDEARAQYDRALADYNATQNTTADVATPFKALIEENKKAFGPLLDSIQESTKKDISNQRLQGDLKGSEYARQLTAVGGLDTKALQYYSALGDEFININKDVTDANGALEAFGQIIVKGSADSIPEITSIVSEIEQLVNLLQDPVLHEDALKAFGGADQAKARLEELRKTGASLLTDVYSQQQLSSLKIPEVQGDVNKPLTSTDLQQVKVQAVKMQQDFYKGYLDFSDTQYDAITENFDAWAQIIQDSGDAFFEKIEGIDPQFFQQAMAKLLEENKLKSQKETPFGIQQLDITSGQGAGLQGKIDYYSQYLKQNFPQYEQKPEEFGVIFSDYVTDVLHGDNLAVKLALEKIVDLNQKQLDGMYNIPEGATFWVPITAAYYKPDAKATEGGGVGDIPGVEENTSATAMNTRALDQLREHLLRENKNTYEEGAKMLGQKKDDARQERLVDRFRGSEANEKGNPPKTLEDQYAMRGRGYSREEEVNKLGGGSDRMDVYRKLIENFKSKDDSTKNDSGNFIEELKNALMKILLGTVSNGLGVGKGAGISASSITGEGGTGGQAKGLLGNRDMNSVAPTVSARLDFRIDNTTTLMVDGRVLASVITPYLASDLVRLEASQGTITKRYVI